MPDRLRLEAAQDGQIDAALQILDRQMIDREGRLVGKVDDLELTRQPDGRIVVTAILSGPGALGQRMPGVLSRIVLAVWRRLHPDLDPAPLRIDMTAVADLGSAVSLSLDDREHATRPLERWADQNVISKLPGASHAPE
jgi:hypothetical protein